MSFFGSGNWLLVLGVLFLTLVSFSSASSGYEAPVNPDTLNITSLNQLFDFLFSALRHSPDISGAFDPFILDHTIQVKLIGLTIYKLELVGFSHLLRITPAVLFYDGRNLTASGTIAAELVQLSADYSLAIGGRQTVTGHLQRAEILFSITVPMTGGGSPYLKNLEMTKLVDWRLTSGSNIVRLAGNTRLTTIEIMTAVSSTVQDMANGFLSKLELPSQKANSTTSSAR